MVEQNIAGDAYAKAEEYKLKLEGLTKEKADIEKQLIILEEQLNPYKKQIETAFGTLDKNELLKIAQEYQKSIEELEPKVN